ncbi:hypothetical protein M427DRAFT_34834 [Gonapodya prolifera JEL478]|uniref:Uncharacterized protein n=1 Tax=Gonapodya prolifera (strain JEL478) TaxID=1344416 RepID=A0A139A6H5_GONPJ|nr:hypothetical protein M427DRAFT_34834 [Gonapodya prolifera JEL478]|eukprot:KXS12268.1 hypothetical protein M427DRAFT_34834 [Gonapodya prolifera JEL478]
MTPTALLAVLLAICFMLLGLANASPLPLVGENVRKSFVPREAVTVLEEKRSGPNSGTHCC